MKRNACPPLPDFPEQLGAVPTHLLRSLPGVEHLLKQSEHLGAASHRWSPLVMSDATLLRLARTVERELNRRDPCERSRETRAEMKRRGLKYCNDAGYGYRWLRGQKVPDEREVEQIRRIVAMHEE